MEGKTESEIYYKLLEGKNGQYKTKGLGTMQAFFPTFQNSLKRIIASQTQIKWQNKDFRLNHFTMERICYQTSRNIIWFCLAWASLEGLVVKNLPASVGDLRDVGSIPWLRRLPGGESVNLLQYSCLEDPMDRGAWWTIVHRVTTSQTWLSEQKLEAPLENHIPTPILIEKATLFPDMWVSKFLSLKPLF